MKTIEQLTAERTGWYTSNDDEHWQNGPFDSREAAEVEAQANEDYLICEAGKRPVRLSEYFEVDTFLETTEDNLLELSNDGDPILDVINQEQQADLEARVRAAIDAWQVAHQIAPVPYMFSFCRPEKAAWPKVEQTSDKPPLNGSGAEIPQ